MNPDFSFVPKNEREEAYWNVLDGAASGNFEVVAGALEAGGDAMDLQCGMVCLLGKMDPLESYVISAKGRYSPKLAAAMLNARTRFGDGIDGETIRKYAGAWEAGPHYETMLEFAGPAVLLSFFFLMGRDATELYGGFYRTVETRVKNMKVPGSAGKEFLCDLLINQKIGGVDFAYLTERLHWMVRNCKEFSTRTYLRPLAISASIVHWPRSLRFLPANKAVLGRDIQLDPKDFNYYHLYICIEHGSGLLLQKIAGILASGRQSPDGLNWYRMSSGNKTWREYKSVDEKQFWTILLEKFVGTDKEGALRTAVRLLRRQTSFLALYQAAFDLQKSNENLGYKDFVMYV